MADLSKPILPPPPGYIVDLDNPQRRGQNLIPWIGIVGLVIATALLIVRVYTKAVLAKKITSDDCGFPLLDAEAKQSSNIAFRVSFVGLGKCSARISSLSST